MLMDKMQDAESLKLSSEHAQSFNCTRDLNVFLTNLVTLRNNAKITQAEMASLISSSGRNYQRLEKGDAEFSISQILKISKIFNCEVSDLFYFKRKIIHDFEVLSESQVMDDLGLESFSNFNSLFFKGYSTKTSSESFLNYSLESVFFREFKTPIMISEGEFGICNSACKKFVSMNNLFAKKKLSLILKDQLILLTLINRLLKSQKKSFYCQFSTVLIDGYEEKTVRIVAYVTRDKNDKCYVSMTCQ